MERGTTRVLYGTLLAGILGLFGTVTAQDVDLVDPDEETTTRFKRGDVNCNGFLSLVDATELAGHLFFNLPLRCDCVDARDVNDDGLLLVDDVIYLLAFLESNGTPPPAPGPRRCGEDPTRDELVCAHYPRVVCGEPSYKRGDVNCDGCVNSSDALLLREHLFRNADLPCDCHDARDANGDGEVTTADVVFLLEFCENDGPRPPSPGPFVCGNPNPDDMNCAAYPRAACRTGCVNQLPGDCNQDSRLDLSDGLCVLNYLFSDRVARLPCGSGHHSHASNVALLNWRGTGSSAVLEMGDAISIFRWLFMGGPPHPLGLDCVWIESCPTVAICASCPELTLSEEPVEQP
jgi:hypothetical protein